MASLAKLLDTAETERTAVLRPRTIRKAQLAIIDGIGYSPATQSQASRFFTIALSYFRK